MEVRWDANRAVAHHSFNMNRILSLFHNTDGLPLLHIALSKTNRLSLHIQKKKATPNIEDRSINSIQSYLSVM